MKPDIEMERVQLVAKVSADVYGQRVRHWQNAAPGLEETFGLSRMEWRFGERLETHSLWRMQHVWEDFQFTRCKRKLFLYDISLLFACLHSLWKISPFSVVTPAPLAARLYPYFRFRFHTFPAASCDTWFFIPKFVRPVYRLCGSGRFCFVTSLFIE